jgi:peptide/nickel transport system substrate-binding protein
MKRRTLLQMMGVTVGADLIAAACGSSNSHSGNGNAPVATGGSGGAATPTAASASSAPVNNNGSGGTLRIAMSAGNIPIPDTAPDQGFEGYRFVGFQIYDPLVKFNVEQGDTIPVPKPALAESWTVSDDKLTWTFKLRSGVTFHDGTPFNADAVIFGLDRVLNKNAPQYSAVTAGGAGSFLQQVKSYSKVDDMTVAFVTPAPYAFLLDDLALFLIASPTAVTKYGADYVKHATGTGPFVMSKYVDGQEMDLEPNKNYWGEKAKLDKLILLPMPEPATRQAALQSGQVDWAEVPPPDSLDQFKAQNYQIFLKPYRHTIIYELNGYKAPFNDVRVRQALNYAHDRAGTVSLIHGVGVPATQYMPEGDPWFDKNWGGYSYDPAKAKQLLSDAGYAKGFKMSLIYPTSGSGNMFPGPMTERLQQDLKAVGIEVDLVPLEWNTIITAFIAGFGSPDWSKYDAMFFSVAPLTAPLMADSLVSGGIPPNGCCNGTGLSDPTADSLYKQAQAQFDETQRDALMTQFSTAVMKNAPVLVSVHDLNLRVMTPQVQGFVQPQSWFANLSSVWMKG